MMVDELLIAHLVYTVTLFLWYLSILLGSLTHLPCDFSTSHFREVPWGVHSRVCYYFIQFLAAESPLGSTAPELHCEITALVRRMTGRTVLKRSNLSLILCTVLIYSYDIKLINHAK